MIYQITNIKNNKRYIGKTKHTAQFRWKQHCYQARIGSTSLLHKAIRKYGEDSFIIEQLDDADEFLDILEVTWIELLQPQYNLTKGGDGGDTSNSPAYQQAMKLRDTSGEKNSMYGKRGELNPKFGKKYGPKPKISEATKVAWNDAERRKLASIRAKGNKNGYHNKKQSKPITIDGVKYGSIGQAAVALNITNYHAKKRGKLNE